MSTITFDTLKFVRRLESGGFTQDQAEAVAEAIKGVADEQQPVTRDYLDARLLITRTELETKIEAVKGDIIKWVAGLLIAQAALIAALVKLL